MKKAFAAACLFFLFSGNSYAQEQPAQAAMNSAASPQLTFVNNDTIYDFGGVPAGTVLEYQFEIKNTGTAPLVISGMKCESANIQCRWPGKAVKPGKKGYLKATYTARGDEGSFKYDIFIASNVTTGAAPTLYVSGAIIPAGGSYIPSSSPSKGKGGRGSRGG